MTSGRLKLGSFVFGGLLGLALVTAPAPALAAGTTKRSVVSQGGSDAGNCAAGTPCRTFGYALSQTVAGGEMLVLDSGGYGGLVITQAVTINAPPGIIAFVSAPAGDAVTVNAGPSDLVILTGFYLDGYGTGVNGVTVNSVGSFSMSGSTITGFTGNPIKYINSAASNQKLTIGRSSFYSNGGTLFVKPTAGLSFFSSIRGLSLSTSGIVVDNSSSSMKMSVLFDNSILRYNGGTAISVISNGTAGAFVQVNIDRSELYNLNAGISATGTGAGVFINESALMNISTLCSVSGGGVVNSYKNNAMTYSTLGCTLGNPVLQ